MFPLNMITDRNPRVVFKVKTYSTSKSVFLIFDNIFIKIFRSRNILKDKKKLMFIFCSYLMLLSAVLWMLVILKSFPGPTIFLAFWTCVGEQVWKMFCLHMQGDTGLSTVCECKAQSTRITSVFIPCHKPPKILRASNILKTNTT